MRSSHLLHALAAVLFALSAAAKPTSARSGLNGAHDLSAACTPDWQPTFGEAPGVDDDVHAFVEFDDGSGPALYVGGKFLSCGGHVASGVARWDGERWEPVGDLDGFITLAQARVYALAVFDDGTGPALYAAGESFTGIAYENIAKWNGVAWTQVGGDLSGPVHALCVYDDGDGAALYAGGEFTVAGGVSAKRVAKWDGQSWSALGAGVNSTVYSLAVYDDGSSDRPMLHAGGTFTTAGGISANRIAAWNGNEWSALGTGTGSSVHAMTVFDDGAGPALFVGGVFQTAGGVAVNRVARWDGQLWQPLGSGVDSLVSALAVHDDGSGPALFVGGALTTAGGAPANRVAKWDGQAWSALGVGTNHNVRALASFDGGPSGSSELIVGGDFSTAGGVVVDRIARWDDADWHTLGTGLNGGVRALALFDDGVGGEPALFAGGEFVGGSGGNANRIARWNGDVWDPLSSGMDDRVNALAVFDDGTGPALYAGGDFTTAGGGAANRVAKWDGSAWSALGSGMDLPVRALCVFDDGTGPALYAGGIFSTAGGVAASRIARWDGVAWSAVGLGMDDWVLALAVHDDGTGPALYAGGEFLTAGGAPAAQVARWDGAAWHDVGGGTNGAVHALTSLADGLGGGPELYAGGGFTEAGGGPARRVAKWNGAAWSALYSGTNDAVKALEAFDDGTGLALYAGGSFTTAGGMITGRIARWDGAAWSTVGAPIGPSTPAANVLAIAGVDGAAGPELFAGTNLAAGPATDSFLARWACAPSSIDVVPGCYGNPAALVAESLELKIASPFTVSLSSPNLTSGLGALLLGVDQTDASGCGLLVPGIGELLLALAPPPVQLATGALSGGGVEFTLPVPNQPSLVGAEIALHGAILGVFDPGGPIELSNGLVTTVAD